MRGFSVVWRNYCHWDIFDDNMRLFCLRGRPGAYCVEDERNLLNASEERIKYFKTISKCMSYICDELMEEK